MGRRLAAGLIWEMKKVRANAALLVFGRTVLFVGLAVGLSACAGRPTGDLKPVAALAPPGASVVDILVATTRAPDANPAVLFSGERARGVAFADISVSIPPDAVRAVGEVQWPSSTPGDPARDFITRSAAPMVLTQARERLDRRLDASSSRHVLVFVHGYNTRFEEAVYRFAQIAHDAHADVLPVLFTWPSRGKTLDYVYDRESAIYSRDALEAVLKALVEDRHVAKVSVLAHSMGNLVAIEALRQMAIRDRKLSPKIVDVMLAAPDIDLDVFRRQIASIRAVGELPPITLFASQDDRALGISRLLAGDQQRLGAIDPAAEPAKSILAEANVRVVDLTKVQASDSARHGKFAGGSVILSIGARLASGQKLNDAKSSFSDTISNATVGAAALVGHTAALAVSTPFAVVDPASREEFGERSANVTRRLGLGN